MTSPRLLVVVCTAMAVCGVGAAGGACGPAKAANRGTPGKQIQSLSPNLVPGQLVGLTVQPEDVSGTLVGSSRSYMDGVALYSMRSSELLQATLQVSRFNGDARYRQAKFRATIVNQIGSTRSELLTVGSDAVYETSGTRQRIFVWFRGRYLFVLAVREDYSSPRSLLRRALELRP